MVVANSTHRNWTAEWCVYLRCKHYSILRVFRLKTRQVVQDWGGGVDRRPYEDPFWPWCRSWAAWRQASCSDSVQWTDFEERQFFTTSDFALQKYPQDSFHPPSAFSLFFYLFWGASKNKGSIFEGPQFSKLSTWSSSQMDRWVHLPGWPWQQPDVCCKPRSFGRSS